MAWQKALADLITDPEELFALLKLDAASLPAARRAATLFPLRIPRALLARMEHGNPHDPLLRQFLPLQHEFTEDPRFSADPLQEKTFNLLPGLLHKYHGRVLLTLTGACAVNCRYCFRREFAYQENNPGMAGWLKVIDYIRADASITEVIFSGGDPLAMSDAHLAKISEKIAAIEHVKRLRIHSRIPVIIPERVCEAFLNWFSRSGLQAILVIHCNHPREINALIKEKLGLLKQAGVTLLNQSVLLRGVNDNADTLISLSETLFSCGVLPYYLHALDRVKGTVHFEVSEGDAKTLLAQMQARLPGYLVPKLVREVAGAAHKVSL